MLRQVYSGHMLLLEVLLLLAALPFLEEVCYVFVASVWEAGLLVVRSRAGYIVLAKMMRLISIVLSSLLTLPLLLYCSFVDPLHLWLMYSKVLGVRALHCLGGMLLWFIGMLYVVKVRVVPFLLFIPGKIGFLLICMVFINGFSTLLRC